MRILEYNELNTTAVQKQYDKVLEMIKRDDFYSAEVKKLTGTSYYRAKLDQTNRLLFKVICYNGEKYALMLEIIHQHAYDKSRFLHGAVIDETKISVMQNIQVAQEAGEGESASYIHPTYPAIHLLDKIISFDPTQQDIFMLSAPVVIIGSAGSGKTMLTLEKMKTYPGVVLYVTGSPYLVQNARNLYYSHSYNNEAQEIDFLSYAELLETLKVPEGQEINFPIFVNWLRSLNKGRIFQDANKLYEEFKGVITGNNIDQPYLSALDYAGLGVKQSIYSKEERSEVYAVFEKYRAFLTEHNYYDSNLISFAYLSRCTPKYDFIVVDEVQDFTPVQLFLMLNMLKNPQNFLLCGDSNQIVHPNFFSWAKIKSLFYQQPLGASGELIRILHKNYRNSPSITSIANKVLKIKNSRFGSIDKESHYLVESQSVTPGEIYSLLNQEKIRQDINDKTAKSTHFAIIVLRQEDKITASRFFNTPLIFSIYEAKGLEYENVILYNFVSSDEKKFRDIAAGVSLEDLQGELVYGRVKDKTDRSLEIYKFYINAFYVAITRAIKNVYLLEEVAQHPFLELLNLQPSAEFVAIEQQESSLAEWQKEMHRLEMQGKQEQADAIRSTLLQTKTVPWQVITREELPKLLAKALNIKQPDKAARLLLFEYALVYHLPRLLTELAAVGFAPATKLNKAYDILEHKYFMGYASSNTRAVIREVDLYGVNFRSPFNQTPLMMASYMGNLLLAKQLLDKGVDLHLTDNNGLNAFQIVLRKAVTDPKFTRTKFFDLYHLLSPSHLNLQSEHKLVKLDRNRMEFMLLNVMLTLAQQKNTSSSLLQGFSAQDFCNCFTHFPPTILPEYRKQRTYISSILAKNEVDRQDPYNRKLFLRVRRGLYKLNPQLLLKVNADWIYLHDLLNLTSQENKVTVV